MDNSEVIYQLQGECPARPPDDHEWVYDVTEVLGTRYPVVPSNPGDLMVGVVTDRAEADQLTVKSAVFVCLWCDKEVDATSNGLMIDWM